MIWPLRFAALVLLVVGIALSPLRAIAATVPVLVTWDAMVGRLTTIRIDGVVSALRDLRTAPNYFCDGAFDWHGASSLLATAGAGDVDVYAYAYHGDIEHSSREFRLGLVSSVVGASIAARGAAGAAEGQLPKYLYHYTSTETAALIESSALGQAGRTLYLTPSGGLSPIKAGIELALPQANTAGGPFRVPTSALEARQILRVGPVTGNVLGRGGGGIEILCKGEIPLNFVTRVR